MTDASLSDDASGFNLSACDAKILFSLLCDLRDELRKEDALLDMMGIANLELYPADMLNHYTMVMTEVVEFSLGLVHKALEVFKQASS